MNKAFFVCSKRNLPGVLLFIIVFFIFCVRGLSAGEPDIDVTPEPNYMYEGTKIMFQVKRVESNRFRWEFGDGRTVTGEARQNHVYRERGVYRVRVYDLEGYLPKPIEKRLTIIKEGREIILEEARYAVGQPIRISSRKFIRPPLEWSFGDGTVQTAGTTVQHIYQRAGTFTIGAKDYGGRGEKTITHAITIAADNRVIEVTGELIAGEAVDLQLKNAAGGDYQWQLDDGKQAGGTVVRDHIFRRAGTVTIRVNDRSGQFLPLTRKITVKPDRRKLRVSPVEAIPGEEIRFEAQQFKGPVKWEFGDGTVTSGGKKQTHRYKEPGRFTVTALDNGGQSRKTFSDTVTISEQTPGFRLTHLEIAFTDGKYYCVVSRSAPPPAYYVKMKAAGKGIVKGKWVLDRQAVGLFQVELTGNRVADMRGNDVPALQLQDLGIHNFTLEFTNYDFPLADKIPNLRYFVSENGAIQIVSPKVGDRVHTAETVGLSWKLPTGYEKRGEKEIRYQIILSNIPIQFLTDEAIDSLWKPAGRSGSYKVDMSHYKRGDWIYWQVRAVGPEGTVLTISEISSFKLVKNSIL
jgi:PKD repeat protein